MCIAVLAWRAHPTFPLVIASNRDESHDRAAEPLQWWNSLPPFVAGRDVKGGGTWFGVDGSGRFALLTNCRDVKPPSSGTRSRGELVPSFLSQRRLPRTFLAEIESQAANYGPFNLMLADESCLWYASNRAEQFARPLPHGVYGLDETIDTPSPKLLRLRRRFEQWLSAADVSPADALFEMLADADPGPSVEWDSARTSPPPLRQARSATFVKHPHFGTRCSTVVFAEEAGPVLVVERSFDASGCVSGEISMRL